ncbi:alkaline phosphatase D family protein, partial [Escherichia coli]|nr:alkaline phosphatase D family protein [Escherichia coli]
ESRLLARSGEPDLAPLFRSADAQKALIAFRDGELQDPARTMLGTEQEAWLGHAMKKSVRAGQKWQLVGFGTIMGKQRMPEQALDWIKPDAP